MQASIGIALAPLHGEDSETLLRRADVALYAAKESRGCFSIYSPDDDLHTPQRLALLGDLRRGIDNDELTPALPAAVRRPYRTGRRRRGARTLAAPASSGC